MREEYKVETDYIINGINKISRDGKTLGGVMSELNPAIGEYMYYPFIVKVDGGSDAVHQIAGNPKEALVIASEGRIEVINADETAVYDLNGRLISRESISYVPAGVYVVKADDATYKINVK